MVQNTFVQEMVWCRQAASHITLANADSDLGHLWATSKLRVNDAVITDPKLQWPIYNYFFQTLKLHVLQ